MIVLDAAAMLGLAAVITSASALVWSVRRKTTGEPEVELFQSDGQIFGTEKFADLWKLAGD